jgi:hypothetical protein
MPSLLRLSSTSIPVRHYSLPFMFDTSTDNFAWKSSYSVKTLSYVLYMGDLNPGFI